MMIDEFGRVIINDSDLIELIYKGVEYDEVFHSNSERIENFNKLCLIYDDDDSIVTSISDTESLHISGFHEARQRSWDVPDRYFDIDLEAMLYDKCRNDIDRERVSLELTLFKESGMYDILYVLNYIVETLVENNILWGIGRGSSVSSLVLYFIGIHSVDPIKYQLSIDEFIRRG